MIDLKKMREDKRLSSLDDVVVIKDDPRNGTLHDIKRSHKKLSDVSDLGYFGNIWVRSHYFAKAGDTNGDGHRHYFDHVTLLANGSVLVEVEGHEPKKFQAPTFIVVEKEHKHKITALTDDVVYYCVFALRDIDGDVTDIYSGDNTAYGAAPDDYWTAQKLQQLDEKTTHED